MKKTVKALVITVMALVGGLIASLVFLDKKEDWLYEKFGKKEVRTFMKRFEPFIVMTEEAEEVIKTVKKEGGEVIKTVKEEGLEAMKTVKEEGLEAMNHIKHKK